MFNCTIGKLSISALAVVLVSACASRPTMPPDVVYRAIPEAWLQPCQLPARPDDNADLSDAFAQAYKCGAQGNKDKAAIRDLTQDPT